LSADVTFFESKLEISTSLSSFAPEDDYDYSFYQETLLNSGGSTSVNVTGKDPLRFQDSIQIYSRRTTPATVPVSDSISSPVQKSSEFVTAQLLDFSITDDLSIALRKDKHNCTHHPLFNFIYHSHLSSFFRSFISSMNSCSIPKNVSTTLSLSVWTKACRRR